MNKFTVVLVMVFLLCSCFVFAGDNLVDPNYVGSTPLSLYYDSTSHKIHTEMEQIKQLGKQGKICEVYGHKWYQQDYGNVYANAVHRPYVTRICTICDKQQKYIIHDPEWVDVEE